MKLRLQFLIITFLISSFILHGQSQYSEKILNQSINPELSASGFHRFIFGSEWRHVWSTPIQERIIVCDSSFVIQNFPSTIIRIHDLTKTRTYLLNGKDGRSYSFTPFNQDSCSSLPSELSELLPRAIVDDQMGTLNPFAPIIASEIQRVLGLPFREIQLAVLPKNAYFLTEEKDLVGILEGTWNLHAQPDSISSQLFETSSMLESIEANLQNRVDEIEYLKCRLIDILIGDWDRSADQWLWMKIETPSGIVWKPVPSFHHQAFVRLNGLLPTVADLAIPQLEDCNEKISSVENLTLTARTLDRRILVSYTKQTWDSLAAWIQTRLTDSVITKVVSHHLLPLTQDDKNSIKRILQSRRSRLLKAAEEFYKLSSAYVEIHLSNSADRVDIRRIGRHIASITLSDRLDSLQKPLYQRLFHTDYTKEIRILLLGGNDMAIIEGEENSSIKIIIDGGEGVNELIDKSKSRSLFASMGLFTASETIFYDYNPGSRLKASSTSTIVRDRLYQSPKKKNPQVNSFQRDWGSEWSVSPWLDINPDDGLFIGGGPLYTQYAYRMDPFAHQLGIRAGLATRTGRYRLDATGEFRDWFRGMRVIIQLHASQLDLVGFYGLGNETSYSQSLYDSDFYKVNQQQLFVRTALDFPIGSFISVSIGGMLKLIDNDPKSNTLLNQLSLPYYEKTLTFLSASGKIQYDTRDNINVPRDGEYIGVECIYNPALIDLKANFLRLRLNTRAYVSLDRLSSIILALRCKAENIWGEHPFFESAFLGGNESLRGFERQRFAGDASVLGGIELRGRLVQIPFIVPLWLGASGFIENGRVFLSSENSQRWHNVIGAGIWFSFIKPDYVVNFSLARSEDKFAFYATMGFMF
jgi:hypothetical protein